MESTITLEFAEYPGEEIVLRRSPVPVGTYFRMVELADATRDGPTWTAFFREFAEAGLIVSWTLEPPIGPECLLSIDFKLAWAIVEQWIAGVRSVPRPLPLTSSDGTPSMREASPSRSPELSSSIVS